MIRRQPLHLVAAALALFSGVCAAQGLLEPDQVDPELQALEDSYAKQVIAARQALGGNYLTALQKLQVDLSKRGQLEQALLVKIERERVAQLLEQAPDVSFPTSGSRPPQTVELDIAVARCSGGVIYDEKRKSLRNWTAAGGSVVWGLDADIPPGRYEVIAGYTAGRDAGGSFEVATADGESASASVATSLESDWREAKTMLAGTLTIGPDSRTLSITATALRQPYLWSLSTVRLEPAGYWEKRQAAKPAEAFDTPPPRKRPPTPRPPTPPTPKRAPANPDPEEP